MKRVISFARVSTEKQDIGRQIDLIKNYCEENEYTIVLSIEEKVSGAKANRKGINQLLCCTDEDADLVICTDMSRLSREEDVLEVANYISSIVKSGLDLMFLDKPDKVYKANEVIPFPELLVLVVNAFANAQERKKISERMNTQKYIMFQRNPYTYFGSRIPFGFDVIDNPLYNSKQIDSKQPTKVLKENPKQIAILKEMYQRTIQGETLEQLRYFLQTKGIEKTISDVSVILKNRLYIGERTRGNMTMNIEPIIDLDTFNQAAIQRNNNVVQIQKGIINFNSLKGIFKCSCGNSMTIRKTRDVLSYGCFNRIAKKDCNSYGVRVDVINNIVWHSYINVIGWEQYSATTKERISKLNADINIIKGTISNLNKTLLSIQGEKLKLSDAILNTDNAELRDMYSIKFTNQQNDERDIKTEIKKLNNEISLLQKNIEDISQIDNINYDIPIQEKAILYKKAISKVVYYSLNNFKGFVHVIYKNGFSVTYMVKKHSLGYVAQLPQTFTFNPETMNVSVEVMNPTAEMNFSFNAFETKTYTFDEIEKNFPVEEWYI